ncbi:class I tRNA ligase family protein [Calycomorphotria hydatis]|uniref:Isoleucine--tRNA ligase n=1 Tax=Calycomorphotria hydatis TaxID=2528027 RepID=A0A517TAV0_9PLAN|nr:class I tRNA ligase family protein [Calycomorphotria hydatis]QDT65497.1 Isoleucine--tRNA ligase [Calycomorphotria hydatis]
MFEKVTDAKFLAGEHEVLKFWTERDIFGKLRQQNVGKTKWSFLDGPITANNPMGVHHAWGRTYKDAYQRFHAMRGEELRYQNGFDCQGLWVEVEVQKEFGLDTKEDIHKFGVDCFVHECKKRVLRFAARQTEQSVRLGYWMDWDLPDTLRKLADGIGTDEQLSIDTPTGETVTGTAEELVAKLGTPQWGGSYFTFSTENNETIWTFLKKCFDRKKVYRGYDVMPWGGKTGSAYSQMEVNDGRKLTTHRSVFVRFPLIDRVVSDQSSVVSGEETDNRKLTTENSPQEYLLVWTTTPWTLTSNVAAAVNPELDYIRIKAKKDGAIYYFAKDNLESKRAEREFKEGFGRPEWAWPKGVSKLKTLAQIFKEQGGYEEQGTVKGAEMIGWRYCGVFDDLQAQQTPGGVPEDPRMIEKTGVGCHAVIDGGRDTKGNPNVTAGEGTGIVHIAPGCGDIDHKMGEENGLVAIAPLDEAARFMDGFGDFTGMDATDPATAKLVFEKLKAGGFHVADEEYPHIYPHCWRTGTELIFRLVDEWFIDMDWRDEIKAVVDEITWLPESIQGKERENEWLTNMRDWMISKKRFWGLALPIWINPDDPTDFEVIGSLEELKERAVEGWDAFEGHTPHKPWIDAVKIKSEKTGTVLSRIEDVGNPWLDAGITPFSTMGYNHNREEWEKWYPADFVTECFPGQFRNWFYSLLALSTMMRHDETDDPKLKRPFKTLLGHRLVMDERGQPMHKSDGTAIWFEEAAEQLGVDTLRWMYLSQSPAQDLRFGTRHPDQPTEITTPEGKIKQTKDGFETCLVTSGPADETRRQILIPLWNSYSFFVNYARLDEFDPSATPIPVKVRPEGDRWILSELQHLIRRSNDAYAAFDAQSACDAAEFFIDDLSNWYIRRNRRRFWRGKGENDTDKNAAYQTLYHVLVELTKVLAPAIPFLSERVYQNLVRGVDDAAPESVHLCEYPQPDESLENEQLRFNAATAQKVVKLGHKLREEAGHRVRQPLGELRYTAGDKEAKAIEHLSDVIADELNVKELTRSESLGDIVKYTYKPNLKTLGPKYGKLLGKIRKELPGIDPALLEPLRAQLPVALMLAGEQVELGPEDVMIGTEQSTEWVAGDDEGVQVALSTHLTDDLIHEGIARDFVRQVQQMRKEADLEIENRITIQFHTQSDDVSEALENWSDYIRNETLADSLVLGDTKAGAKEVPVGNTEVSILVCKV